jgi:hypothetical protein
MEVSPYAGKLAEPAMLVNVPKLVTAYFTEVPDPSVPTRHVVYIENTPMFVQIAEGLGIRSILQTDYRSTCVKLASFGLQNDEGLTHETS